MKTILAYGDSLTWGSDPHSGGRHPKSHRWPDALAEALAGRAEIITDGLRGRTTAYDEHLADCDRNGARILPTVLYAHAPLDLVILMLGANDLKPHIAGTALAAMQGMRRCISIVQNHVARAGDARPEVIVVAPPPLCDTANNEFAAMFAGRVEQSKMVASLYRDLADEAGAGFFDAGSVCATSPADGVHVDSEGTRALGLALAPLVSMQLGL
ncbi:MAG: SGNH/GDSL hydrolase family protein [Rhizobiaceae bacterium]|jgi:lysophospholipase L1-like esterase|nr:SGNH/GDSL hydrolase family protein [Rhizobiaceae bacterium]